jgi:glycosyltransferase involved in cell wall biosynthesis
MEVESIAAASQASLVITTYNHARFLGEAIRSALSQTVPFSEILVVDDGSSDRPEEVTRDYPSVKIIHQANQGLSVARNTGLAHARGKFLAFLDADDRLLPSALAINLRLFAKEPDCGFVYGSYRYIDEKGAIIRPELIRDPGSEPYSGFLRGNLIGMHAAVLYDRSRLAEVGGFDPNLRACEDYDVYLRMARRFAVAFGPDCLAEYRLHRTNMSSDCVMMLRAALRVLGKQRSIAETVPAWRDAYRRGVADWKAHFVGQFFLQTGAALKARELPIGFAARAATLAALAPLTMLRMSGVAGRIVLRKLWRTKERHQ